MTQNHFLQQECRQDPEAVGLFKSVNFLAVT